MTQDITSKTLQHDYILLDGSSSMISKWYDTLSSIHTYFSTLRAQNIESDCTLHIFSSVDPDYIARSAPLSQFPSLIDDPPGSHWGSTPLYDAINLMGRRLRDLDPPRASIIIATDGEENASRFTDSTQARAILDWCRAKGWQITFIGVDFRNSSQSALLGATEANAIGVQKHLLADAAANLAKKRAKYALSGDPMHFTDGERQQFGGYLNAPDSGSN